MTGDQARRMSTGHQAEQMITGHQAERMITVPTQQAKKDMEDALCYAGILNHVIL